MISNASKGQASHQEKVSRAALILPWESCGVAATKTNRATHLPSYRMTLVWYNMVAPNGVSF